MILDVKINKGKSETKKLGETPSHSKKKEREVEGPNPEPSKSEIPLENVELIPFLDDEDLFLGGADIKAKPTKEYAESDEELISNATIQHFDDFKTQESNTAITDVTEPTTKAAEIKDEPKFTTPDEVAPVVEPELPKHDVIEAKEVNKKNNNAEIIESNIADKKSKKEKKTPSDPKLKKPSMIPVVVATAFGLYSAALSTYLLIDNTESTNKGDFNYNALEVSVTNNSADIILAKKHSEKSSTKLDTLKTSLIDTLSAISSSTDSKLTELKLTTGELDGRVTELDNKTELMAGEFDKKISGLNELLLSTSENYATKSDITGVNDHLSGLESKAKDIIIAKKVLDNQAKSISNIGKATNSIEARLVDQAKQIKSIIASPKGGAQAIARLYKSTEKNTRDVSNQEKNLATAMSHINGFANGMRADKIERNDIDVAIKSNSNDLMIAIKMISELQAALEESSTKSKKIKDELTKSIKALEKKNSLILKTLLSRK